MELIRDSRAWMRLNDPGPLGHALWAEILGAVLAIMISGTCFYVQATLLR